MFSKSFDQYTSSNYSNVYLFTYKFNSSSSLYQHLTLDSNTTETSINTTTTTTTNSPLDSELSNISVKVGYLALCLSAKDIQQCTSYVNLNTIPQLTITFLETDFNLLNIAQTFHESIVHSRLLMASILLTLALLLILCYLVLPISLGALGVKRVGLVLSFANMMLWGLGSMLQHQSVNATTKVLSEASFQVVQVERGQRAETITWVAFSFLIVVFLSFVMTNYAAKKNLRGANTFGKKGAVMEKV
ncbi:hypothetical protein CANMA_002346 [Candida margitis]|uniref:uncharacterized protein n=1 Tax=Candida margitis TaxID=1775924 RepID=UPI002227425B|nr:uncharacterized protein CANMA_002346 [Candida margitis]KAI5968601.1 hypothetical protein CANMA_002346 [Candida margitis]